MEMLELAVLRKEKQTMICRYGRTGIYHMQDVMKIINEGITNRSVLFLYLNWSTGCTQNKLYKKTNNTVYLLSPLECGLYSVLEF
jgi:hypothetical protein